MTDNQAAAEAREQAAMAVAIAQSMNVSADGVPQGWIGPVEALRREHKIRDLRQRVRELEAATHDR